MRMRGTYLGLVTFAIMAAAMTGLAWASEGGGHHELNWWDFFLRLMNFAIMLGLLIYLAKKPLANFFVSRREGIQNTLTELEHVQEGEAEKNKIIETAHKQAEYLKQQAQMTIQQEIKKARESLQEEIADLTVAAAEDILRKNIKAKDQDRLVQEFIAKVVEAK
jgi:F-type H+-transporting ATPase subunit b